MRRPAHLVLIEVGKRIFYRAADVPPARHHRTGRRYLRRRTARFSTA